MNSVRPIGNNIYFKFRDTVKAGHFVDQHSSGIIVDLGQNHHFSTHYSRVGDVIAVGENVKTIKPGDTIVIKTLMWTDRSFLVDGERFWMTAEQHVLGTL